MSSAHSKNHGDEEGEDPRLKALKLLDRMGGANADESMTRQSFSVLRPSPASGKRTARSARNERSRSAELVDTSNTSTQSDGGERRAAASRLRRVKTTGDGSSSPTRWLRKSPTGKATRKSPTGKAMKAEAGDDLKMEPETTATATVATSSLPVDSTHTVESMEDSSGYFLPTSYDPQRVLDTADSIRGFDRRAGAKSSGSSRNNKVAANAMLNLSNHLKEGVRSVVTALGDSVRMLDNDDFSSEEVVFHNDDLATGKDKSYLNVFPSREDLRVVDQSVNLMDAETAKYEDPLARGGSPDKHKRNTFRQSLVEVFLGDHRKSLVEVFLGDHRDSNRPTCHSKKASERGGVVNLLWRLCTLVLLVVALGAAVALIPMVLELQNHDKDTTANSPISSPTKAPKATALQTTNPPPAITARKQALLSILLSANDPVFDSEASSPAVANEAITWMVSFDPAHMPFSTATSDKEAIQRFALATLYFATHPHLHANSTDLHQLHRPQEEEDEQGRSLVGSQHLVHWMTPSNVCHWGGITCSLRDSTVEAVHLGRASLQGNIPAELVLLTSLRGLDLSQNQLKGTVPESLSRLESLQTLKLDDNSLTGSVDSVLCPLKTKHSLDFLSADCASVDCSCCDECH